MKKTEISDHDAQTDLFASFFHEFNYSSLFTGNGLMCLAPKQNSYSEENIKLEQKG